MNFANFFCEAFNCFFKLPFPTNPPCFFPRPYPCTGANILALSQTSRGDWDKRTSQNMNCLWIHSKAFTDGFQCLLEFSVMCPTNLWQKIPSKIAHRCPQSGVGPWSSCFGFFPVPCALSCGSLQLPCFLAASRSFLQSTPYPFSCGCSASSIYCTGPVSLPSSFRHWLLFSSWRFSFTVPFVRPLLKSRSRSAVVCQWWFHILIFSVLHFIVSVFLCLVLML